MTMSQKKIKFDRTVVVRLSKEAHDKAKELLRDHPGDYRNMSDVIRGGIFALHRWKQKEGLPMPLNNI